MKFVIATIIVLIAAAALAVYAQQDPGYIMITFHDWTIETSFVFFAAVLLLGFVVLYFLFRLLIATGLLPRHLRRWRKLRSTNLGRKQLAKGMMKLNLGQWHDAERLLIKSARNEELAPLAYLSAARAAEGLGNTSRRDGYIQLAQKKSPKDALALSLAQAQIQTDFGHSGQAIQTLTALPSNQRNSPAVLRHLSKLYSDNRDWPALVELLPQVKQLKILPEYKFYEMELSAYRGLINHIAEHQDAQALWTAWDEMPARMRKREELVVEIACAMINFGQSDAVESLLYEQIKRQWSDSLVYIYGLLDGDAEVHLARAGNWLRKHANNPVLLLTLGRLALRAHQWDKAREHLQESLKITPQAEAYQELGNLLAFLNEQPQAVECYRRGLALSSESVVQPELKTGLVERTHLPRPNIDLSQQTQAQLEPAQA
jgi:HemY protein